MPEPALSITLDHAQTRLRREMQQTTVSGGVRQEGGDYGSQWQGLLGENTWVDPETFRAILLPLPYAPEWQTTGTGDYARLKRTDFTDGAGTVLPTTDWRDDAVLHPTDWYLTSLIEEPYSIWSAETWERNEGVWLSAFLYVSGTGGENDLEVLHWGFGLPGQQATSPLSFRLYASMRLEVWRYGVLDGEGSLAASSRDRGPNADGPDAGPRFVGIMCLPWCTREVLTTSSLGGGFSHIVGDIGEDAAPEEAEIVPEDSRFWLYSPVSGCKVQIARLRFREEGRVVGIKSVFLDPPEAGSVADVTVYGDILTQPGPNVYDGYLVRWDDETAEFEPDGVERKCRVRVDLSSDGTGTPVVYAAVARFGAETDETDGSEELNATGWATAASLDVPDSFAGSKLEIELRNPAELEQQGISNILDLDCRPVRAAIGEHVIWDGWGDCPKLTDGVPEAADAIRIMVESRDLTRQLSEYEFSDYVPLDGLKPTEAMALVLELAGVTRVVLPDIPDEAPIGSPGGQAKGDWGTAIEPGDDALEWLDRLYTNYFGRSLLVVRPAEDGSGPEVALVLETDLPTDPEVTIYDDPEAAYAALVAGGMSSEDAARNVPHYVPRDWRRQRVPCQANIVWVSGQDPRRRRPIIARRIDEASLDPTVPTGLRPDNWVGGPRKFGLIDPTLLTQAAVDAVADLIAPRLFAAPETAEWSSSMLLRPGTGIPAWRGQVVRRVHLDGSTSDWRIQSFKARFEKEPSAGDDWRSRPTAYVATRVVEQEFGTYSLGSATGGLAAIIERRRLQRQERLVVRRRGEHLKQALRLAGLFG